MRSYFQKGRNRVRGSSIAELGPALILILVAVLFPLLDMVWIGLGYCAGWYLNSIEAREVACNPPIEAKPSGNFIPANYTIPESASWNNLFGVTESSPPQIAQTPNPNNANLCIQSTVKTTVSLKPFIPVPNYRREGIIGGCSFGILQIPGLTEPITFTYTSTVYQEQQGAYL